MKIKELANCERPYEKSLSYGVSSLTTAELLAIIIKTGTKNKSALEISNEILKITNGKLRNVFFGDFKEIENIKGIRKYKNN